MLKNKSIVLICALAILLGGCWDVINIEDRGFIIGTAIDMDEKTTEKAPTFTITNQMVIPAGITTSSQAGGGNDKSFLNFTWNGKSIYKTDEEISAISSKVPFYEHLAVLIISEDVAKEKHLFSNLLDTYIRDVNFRRGIKVVVTNGEAKKLLDFTTPEDKLPAMHIKGLLEHSSKEIGFLKPKRIGDIEEYHLRENSYVLPLLSVNDYVEHKAGAIFHGPEDRMVGIFNGEEMQGLELMKTEATEKVIEFPYKDHIFALEVNDAKNKVTVDPSNIDEIKITVTIKIHGILKESYSKINLEKTSELKAIQKAVCDQVEQSIKKSIKKGQEDLGTDVFNIWRILETKHYDTWKKVKKDWEKGEYYFKKATFDIKVETDIYSIGTSSKTD